MPYPGVGGSLLDNVKWH